MLGSKWMLSIVFSINAIEFPDEVRNVAIHNRKLKYNAGDVITCTAEGKPTPKVEWLDVNGTPVNGTWTSDQGSTRSALFKATEEMEGNHWFTCQATNNINDQQTVLSESIDFAVVSSGKHDDVIKWKHFPRNWPFVRGIHRSRWIPHTQRPVTRSFDVFFDLRLNKRSSKQPWGWWFETPSWSLWRQCNIYIASCALPRSQVISLLIHWSRDKMAAISQTTLSIAFSWMKMLEFRLTFHWSLFLRV